MSDHPIPRSQGHIRFSGSWEFYRVGEHIYRAPIAAPVMPDGFRCGRWWGPAWMESEVA